MKKQDAIKKPISKKDTKTATNKVETSTIRKDEIPNLLKGRPFKIIFYT